MRSKPTLLFFANRYQRDLPQFLLMHHAEHVSCLSNFFKVVVINEDVDYQQACELHSPDLALFETGWNLLGYKRPKIRNVHSCSHVPKVALINADAWSETRSGALSDMDQWGIE